MLRCPIAVAAQQQVISVLQARGSRLRGHAQRHQRRQLQRKQLWQTMASSGQVGLHQQGHCIFSDKSVQLPRHECCLQTMVEMGLLLSCASPAQPQLVWLILPWKMGLVQQAGRCVPQHVTAGLDDAACGCCCCMMQNTHLPCRWPASQQGLRLRGAASHSQPPP